MRVFITSTPDELESCQEAAVDVVRELGHEPVLRDPAARRGLDPVSACRRQVARADAVLAIVGWRRGRVPAVALGGDNLRPWSYWEVEGAFEHDLPVVALLAGEVFAPELREDLPEAHAVVADFRGELARLAAVFDDETDFRRLAHAKLRDIQRASQATKTTWTLRRFPPPELPTHPYPLLLPYTHPDLMAGRDDDLADLRRILERPVTVVGLHAASGTGKSSLLSGGLVPALRAEGRPVAFVRHPAEAGLAARLLADLVEDVDVTEAMDARGFVDRLVEVRQLADGAAPVLAVDQFEDLFKDGAQPARAAMGMLLAASAQRLPGTGGPPCRWLLAYRQEYHGKLVEWLGDVLRDARAPPSDPPRRGRDTGFEDIGTLPHDLSGPSRFVSWALRPLATPPPESDDPVEASARVFLDAIEKPLKLMRGAFPWTFAPGHAERLARAFAEARVRRLAAPLVPELQVVLAHLLDQAGELALTPDTAPGQPSPTPKVVEVPDEPAELIDRALEEHLRRALDLAFPHRRAGDARTARTRALLVLRELADVHGRREEGREADALARALGKEGREVLEKLSTPRTRLVLLEHHDDRRADPWVYVLSHDRLAEVLVRVVDEGRWAGLDVDAELLGMRRFVALQSQLYASGDVEQATAVSAGPLGGDRGGQHGHWGKIEANEEVLLWNDEHRAWWEACRKRRRRERRRKAVRRSVAAVLVALVALAAWTVADRRVRRRALLGEVAKAEPEAAFAALDELTRSESRSRPGYDAEELLDRLREREKPFDVFDRGLGGVGEERRAEVVLRVAELALPILEASPKDPVLIASLVWALDFFAGHPARGPAYTDRALALRNKVLAPLRRSRPPPPMPGLDDPNWADIPAGTFWMGAGPDDGRDHPNMQDEKPRHQVTLSPFRMMTHEVTNAEYRRLVRDHEGGDDLPAVLVSWYEALHLRRLAGGAAAD